MIIWKGPSELDGAPIVVIATKNSRNPKTGDMVQFWVLRSDIHPSEAISTGADAAICGDCKLRGGGGVGRSCYVNPMGPASVYNRFKRGGYGDYVPYNLPGRGWAHLPYRFTAYGDPAAVPLSVWRDLLLSQDFTGRNGSGIRRAQWTGYTHQWRKLSSAWAQYFHASVDSPAEAAEARLLGWSTFEVCEDTDGRVAAVECVNSSTDGRVNCAACRLCSGGPSSSVWIQVHGNGSGNFADAVGTAFEAECVGVCDG